MSNAAEHEYSVIPVTGRATRKMFASVARAIYRDDPHWICPLDRQIEQVFDPRSNPCFEAGEAARWILKDRWGRPAGRIAAFVNYGKVSRQPVPSGGIGFFECVESAPAARILFDTAIAWLRARDMKAAEGPVNFGENDRYWGLLVEGFTAPPFTTNYNRPYYRSLFEAYGFRVTYEMFTSEIDLSRALDERFARIASRLGQRNDIEVRHASRDHLPEFAAYFREIYNDAWRFHDGFTPLSTGQAERFAREMRYLVIDRFCPFAFVDGEPAGCIIAAPDLNQIFRKFRGRPGWLQGMLFNRRRKNDFKWYRDRGILTRAHAIAIGVRPRFQQRGIESAMIMSSIGTLTNLGFTRIELRWAGDFNPKIIRLHAAVGAYRIRKHVVMKVMFNRGEAVTAPTPIPPGKILEK